MGDLFWNYELRLERFDAGGEMERRVELCAEHDVALPDDWDVHHREHGGHCDGGIGLL